MFQEISLRLTTKFSSDPIDNNSNNKTYLFSICDIPRIFVIAGDSFWWIKL
jgi:hypothetical protein